MEMAMTPRRQFLTVFGGGAIFAAAGCSTTPQKALVPWDAAPAETDPRRFALSHALLAPNPHNMQPWLVRLEGDDTAVLYFDPEKGLPETDPFDRQLTIGFGCFLEQMTIAAAEVGYRAETELFPEGYSAETLDTRPVARIRFVPGAAADPLFAQVPHRRSAKVPFEMARVPDAALAMAMNPSVEGVRYASAVVDTDVAPIRKMMWDAWVVEIETERTYRESIEVMRLGRREIDANPDGIDLGGGMLEPMIAVGLINRESLATPGTMAYDGGWDQYRDMLMATPSACWLTTPGNSREDQIAAGRAWLRLNLQTTAAGLSLHPVSQALQEYPEMAQQYTLAHSLLAVEGETVQMLGRLGYAEAQPRTPRWTLNAKLI
jgi:hypothetical protein